MTDQAAFGWLNVSRETAERLQAFQRLVERWTPAINLVAKSTVPDLWARHILDSAQIYDLAPKPCQHWVDLGSGGGFPGLVIAIMAMETQPQLRITLVESDRRKAVFLNEAIRLLSLPAAVICDRIESIAPQRADVLSARALASLDALCGFAALHLAPGGVAIFPKGANAPAERAEAARNWRFASSETPSKTDAGAVILCLKDIQHV